MGEQRSIKVHHEQLDRCIAHLVNLSAAPNLCDARTSGEITANAHAPAEAEAGNERAYRVCLTIAKLQDRRGTWTQESR
jgi:hypothetical protein